MPAGPADYREVPLQGAPGGHQTAQALGLAPFIANDAYATTYNDVFTRRGR